VPSPDAYSDAEAAEGEGAVAERHKKIALLGAVCAAALVFGINRVAQAPAAAVQAAAAQPVIVIDPGHGGSDGGAVGTGGLVEKDVNLALSLALADQFRAAGYRVVLTRSDDRSIHDPGVTGVRRQKTSDLHNRLALMQQYPGGIVLCIHQNQFSQSQYSGGQVFYGTRSPEKSKALAQAIQTNLKAMLQPGNNREIKEACDTLYLMRSAPGTAVLVECGFLSNPDEARLLARADYQRRVAFVIFASTLQYLQKGL